MKIHRIVKLALLLAIAVAIPGIAQAEYCYTESGDVVNLTVQDSLIAIEPYSDGIELWGNIFMSEPGLDPAVEPRPLAENFALFRVRPGYTYEALETSLGQNPLVKKVTPVVFTPNGKRLTMTYTFICNFHPTATPQQINSMNAAHGVAVRDTLFGDPYWLLLEVTATSDRKVLDMANLYHESSLVRFARASMSAELELWSTPDDPLWQHQYHFHNDGSNGGRVDADIDLDDARNYSMPNTPMVIAILDDGVPEHEELLGERLLDGYDYFRLKDNAVPGHYNWHGIGVAGIIAAMDSNSTGVCGMTGFASKILGQKITGERNPFFPNDPLPSANDAQIALAISDAIDAGAKVINNAWGCVYCAYEELYPTTPFWIRKADSLGVVMVFASGNRGLERPGELAWPAMMPEVIAVGACDKTDYPYYWANYGPGLDVISVSSHYQPVLADLWTLDQMGDLGANPQFGPCDGTNSNYNCRFGGTSAACAQVTGVVAMILKRRPDLTGDTEKIREIIRCSAEKEQFGGGLNDTGIVTITVGWGRLNAARALAAITRGDADNNGTISISDAVYLISYIFAGGPPPKPAFLNGDSDGSGSNSISDAVYLINYIFAGGPEPPISYTGQSTAY